MIRDATIVALGISAGAGRAAALRQLVLQIPAPVIAKALGYHDKTATVVLAEAGGTWNSPPLPAPRPAKKTHDRPLGPGRRP